MSRIGCLFVPLFPLAARLRAEPELRSEALAIVEGSGGGARIVAATRAARRAGVAAGSTLAQARALVPKLVTRGRDRECEHAAQEALLEIAESFSPRVEDGGAGLAFLDAAGTARRFRGGDPEERFTRALDAAARAAALPARVAVAGSKLAARVAAEGATAPAVVPPGEEAAFLAPLPLARLAPELALAETFARWGLRSIGDLARLPPNDVASRMGSAGSALHAIARGVDPHPLVPREPPGEFREGMDLEWPLATLEPFLFLARAALDRLVDRLDRQGLGCARLEVALRLEPDGCDERAIALPAPTREAKTLLTLVRLALEERAPGAAVVGFTFAAHPDRPRAAQLALFGPAALSPDRLATTLARLFALLGPDRAGSPRPVDAHRPESFALVPFAPPPPPVVATSAPAALRSRGLLAVRTLRPPVEIEVRTRGAPDASGSSATSAAPAALAPIPGEANRGRPEIAGAIAVASGPWRLEERWWSADEAIDRDYWDVEVAGGAVYRIYHERPSGRWYADGVYD